ncbi:hypothetical protein AB0E83_17500 [Streptomyces sp. NPDC035033]|uniref:hypothetical protein n=1 Tax=Streptomyces sp. NPDC035033 TaxID=3155368 RepID=UPI00340B070A
MDADFLVRHHDRLAAWLRDGEAGSLDAFLGAHHESFALVTAEGAVLGLEELGEALRGAGGSRPGLAIRVEEVAGVAPGVCRFLERHLVDGSVVAERVVTAVARDGALLAVQETDRRREAAGPASPGEAGDGYGQA